MATYKIYSEETFESTYGTIHKGDEINCVHFDDEQELKRWLYDQYILTENIRVSYKRIN